MVTSEFRYPPIEFRPRPPPLWGGRSLHHGSPRRLLGEVFAPQERIFGWTFRLALCPSLPLLPPPQSPPQPFSFSHLHMLVKPSTSSLFPPEASSPDSSSSSSAPYWGAHGGGLSQISSGYGSPLAPLASSAEPPHSFHNFDTTFTRVSIFLVGLGASSLLGWSRHSGCRSPESRSFPGFRHHYPQSPWPLLMRRHLILAINESQIGLQLKFTIS